MTDSFCWGPLYFAYRSRVRRHTSNCGWTVMNRANSGHSSRALNFLHSGHWSDLQGTEVIASEPHRDLARKLQLSLNRLKARLFAQRVEERVGLHVRRARAPQPQRRLEPFERLGPIAPL